MRKLILLAFILIGFLSKAQDTKPTNSEFTKLLAPNTPVFWYNQIDSAVWVFKGSYGWTKLADSARVQKDYVRYENSIRDVDLGDKKISSTKQRLPLFNGACQVSTILDNGDGSISVGDGEYHVSTNVEGRGSENFPITGGTFTLTDNTTNYLVADYNSGTPILRVTTDVNEINETTIVPVYTAYRSGNILHFQNWDSLGIALANKIHQSIVKTQRYRRESGLALSEYGTRNIALSSGRVWTGAVPVSIAAIATAVDNLFLFYHSGGTWTATIATQYNNTQYDNGTNLVTLTANRYAVNWIYRGVENQKHLYIILGTGDYTLAQAQEAVLPAAPTAITSHSVLVGKIIVQRDAATSTAIQSAFDTQFSTATPNAHNDLTGRDVVDTHPASSITNTPAGTTTATTVQDAINQLDAKKEPLLTKGSLTAGSSKVTIGGTGTGALIGAGASVDVNEANIVHQNISGSGANTHAQIDTHIANDGDLSATNEIQAPTRVGDLIGLTQTTTTIDISDKAPSSGSGNYIWNGTSPQTANFNITGSGTIPDIRVGSLVGDYGSRFYRYSTNAILLGIPGLTSSDYFAITKSNGGDAATFYGDGTATFASTVDATGYKQSTVDLRLSPLRSGFQGASETIPVSTGATTDFNWSAIKTINGNSILGSGDISISGATNLSTTTTTTTVTIVSDSGTDAVIPAATTSAAGVLTASDKTKLDGIAEGADNYGSWGVSVDGTTSYQVNSFLNASGKVDFLGGDGIATSYGTSGGRNQVTSTLDIYELTTIVNPTLAGFLPYTTTGTNAKITLTTLKGTIGSTAGTADLLVMRDGSGDAYAHNFILSSDRRLKKNIKPLSNTKWTNKIQFKEFKFKNDPANKTRYGIIAQDVEKIAPELVTVDGEGNKSVAYIDLLIAKIVELEKRIEKLEKK